MSTEADTWKAVQRDKLLDGSLTYELAIKARELVDGMRKRVNRDPDVADFQAAFTQVIEERLKW